MSTKLSLQRAIRILAIGLNAKEAAFVKHFAERISAQAVCVQDELGLMENARSVPLDIVLLGQKGDEIDPSYFIWLLKGIIPFEKVVMLFDKIDEEEMHKLNKLRVAGMFVRPTNPQDLSHAFEKALVEKERKETNFFDRLKNYVPFLKSNRAA